ncbi:uncharacterized protein LOC142604671 [Balearica regulorum gibbericeps]|uniref:uncharacterized protein LOC142604671 n=1 Tax=Balearica regulorum gibbericeps TaxID=100784 RepID=UPI003F60948D
MQNARDFAAALGREAPGPCGCGELGVPAGRAARGKLLPGCHQHVRPLGQGKEGACVAVGAACRQDIGPVGLCPFPRHAMLRGEDGRARVKVVSQFYHRSVSQGESESLRAEPSPAGVPTLPLPFLLPPHPSARSRRVPAHGTPSAARPCSPPAQTSPTGAQPVAGGEGDPAPRPVGQAVPQPCSQAQRGENSSLSAETSRKAPWAPWRESGPCVKTRDSLSVCLGPLQESGGAELALRWLRVTTNNRPCVSSGLWARGDRGASGSPCHRPCSFLPGLAGGWETATETGPKYLGHKMLWRLRG